MPGEEPFAPLFVAGEDAGVTGEVLRYLLSRPTCALFYVFASARIEEGQAVLQTAGVGGRDGEGFPAAFVAAGLAGQPIPGPQAGLGEGGVYGGQHLVFQFRFISRDHLITVIEILSILSIFALFYGIAVYGWMRAGLRERKRGKILDQTLIPLLGQDVHRAKDLLGEPTKVEFGMSGRRLYIWRPPAALDLPETAELMVVTLTVEANDVISATSWKTD